jgi:phage terminase small subunit
MLSAKQEKFVQCIIEGMSQSDAYRSAYSTKNMTDKSVWESASRVMNDIKVAARIKELRDKIAQKSIMTAQERLEWLTSLIKSAEETTADKLKASDQMNKMQGEYVQKVQANVTYEDNLKMVMSDDEY